MAARLASARLEHHAWPRRMGGSDNKSSGNSRSTSDGKKAAQIVSEKTGGAVTVDAETCAAQDRRAPRRPLAPRREDRAWPDLLPTASAAAIAATAVLGATPTAGPPSPAQRRRRALRAARSPAAARPARRAEGSNPRTPVRAADLEHRAHPKNFGPPRQPLLSER